MSFGLIPTRNKSETRWLRERDSCKSKGMNLFKPTCFSQTNVRSIKRSWVLWFKMVRSCRRKLGFCRASSRWQIKRDWCWCLKLKIVAESVFLKRILKEWIRKLLWKVLTGQGYLKRMLKHHMGGPKIWEQVKRRSKQQGQKDHQ